MFNIRLCINQNQPTGLKTFVLALDNNSYIYNFSFNKYFKVIFDYINKNESFFTIISF